MIFKRKANFIEGKRKYLFCTDQKGMDRLTPIIDKVIDNNYSFELVFIGENHGQERAATDLSKWLSGQKMGSYLYVAGTWDKLKSIKHLAEEIGFSNEEAQYIGYGVLQINVFCCRCHEVTHTYEQAEINCSHCGLLLSVSNHYSSLKDAYLGYVAKL